MHIFLLFLCLMGAALAQNSDEERRPKSFQTSFGRAVFVNFTEATYEITYDVTSKTASVQANMSFHMPEAGLPIFDSVQTPELIELDGSKVTDTVFNTPNQETLVRIIEKVTSVGKHKLKIKLPLKDLLNFSDEGVRSAFWTSDLDERQFLERYMPANFEFDQVKMTFLVNFIGNKKRQKIYTNGEVTEVKPNTFKIEYPAYYTASSIFFHTLPEDSSSELSFGYTSIDGRNIPGVVYLTRQTHEDAQNLRAIMDSTVEVLRELESDYGPFPHPTITVYHAGYGGMEYCGATMTDMGALGHELFHSYFARGVMPANGNSGWVDEALASWRDDGYQSLDELNGSSMMSNHPYYTRITDQDAYQFGSYFMGYLNHKLAPKGGLKPFMRQMVKERKFKPFLVEDFITRMSEFYAESLLEDFQTFTYGTGPSQESFQGKNKHQKMSLQELREHL